MALTAFSALVTASLAAMVVGAVFMGECARVTLSFVPGETVKEKVSQVVGESVKAFSLPTLPEHRKGIR